MADKAPFLMEVRLVDELNRDGYEDAAMVNDCAPGPHGSMAMFALNMLGYTKVRDLGGGMNAWIAAELPVVK